MNGYEYKVTIKETRGQAYRFGVLTVVTESPEAADAFVKETSNWAASDVDWDEWSIAPITSGFTVIKVEGLQKVRRPRVDLMPYIPPASWEDIYSLDDVAGSVLSLDTRNNTGLYIGICAELKTGVGLIIRFEDSNYDFDMEKVKAEALKSAGGNYGVYTLCEYIAIYCEDRSPRALKAITEYCVDFPDRIDTLYSLRFEEVSV